MVDLRPESGTGLPELDTLLHGLISGDNIVWHLNQVTDYQTFVDPFYKSALSVGRKPIYFRFAHHPPLIPMQPGVVRYDLEPQKGFENFLDSIHAAMEQAGRGAFFVFDCLSDLTADWFSDQMLRNFFLLTCPYLYDFGDIAYFALLRNHHSLRTTSTIRETAQVSIDLFNYKGRIYLRPLKVQHRYLPSRHVLYLWNQEQFTPVTDSCSTADILASHHSAAIGSTYYRMDTWNRAFIQAEQTFYEKESGSLVSPKTHELFLRLLRMVVSRDEHMLSLAEKYFNILDLFEITKRTIGTGLIGGKSVGMLLARAILRNEDKALAHLLEVHDSFFVASDVFYTFLVRNGCWWLRKKQQDSKNFLKEAEQARQRILTGSFPEEIDRQFMDMLDYFGSAPIIVRSSSLLEDSFGNAFAGKYASVFCPNQGSRQQRLEEFISAVKTVYASSMSEDVLKYRARHGILEQDEQMALLVQRVSGSLQNGLYYPQLAGVGFSFNPYPWSEFIEPESGLLRLVFGLGTRAVDRVDDDHTRLVALNAPHRRPDTYLDGNLPPTQQKVDVLDLDTNEFTSMDYRGVLARRPTFPASLFISRDLNLERAAEDAGQRRAQIETINFEGLFSCTDFIENMRKILICLDRAYQYPVDMEFTANFQDPEHYKINIVQCRPLQVRARLVIDSPHEDIAPENLILKSGGPMIGQSRLSPITRMIYVTPSAYAQLPVGAKHSVARLIGRLTHVEGKHNQTDTILIGPGRWGTSTPSLGVPVAFSEISSISVLVEIVAMRKDLIPEVSLGTHFFSELVEMDILYLALYPDKHSSVLNTAFFEQAENQLLKALPAAQEFEEVVKVIEVDRSCPDSTLQIYANTLKQEAWLYLTARQGQAAAVVPGHGS